MGTVLDAVSFIYLIMIFSIDMTVTWWTGSKQHAVNKVAKVSSFFLWNELDWNRIGGLDVSARRATWPVHLWFLEFIDVGERLLHLTLYTRPLFVTHQLKSCSLRWIHMRKKLLDEINGSSYNAFVIKEATGQSLKYFAGHFVSLLLRLGVFYGSIFECIDSLPLDQDRHRINQLVDK